MNKLSVTLVAMLLALSACAGGSGTSDDSSGLGDASGALTTEVRIRGVDARGFSLAWFSVRDLRVEVDGHPVATEVESPKINLTVADQAWLAGKFALPKGAKTVTVTLALDSYGAYSADTGAGGVEVRGRPIVFTADVAKLRNPKVVALVDVARSLVPDDTGVNRFVPQFSLDY